MPHDNRIIIRLYPHQLKPLHRILRAIIDRPRFACILGLTTDDVETARNLIERIPTFAPIRPEAATDSQ